MYTYICIYIYIYMYICMYIDIYMHICIYIYMKIGLTRASVQAGNPAPEILVYC